MIWYEHQRRLLEANPKKHLMCWSTGTGKTLASLGLCYQNGKDPLIICPKSLKEKWHRDATMFLNERGGTHMPPGIVSKEEFRRDWNTLPHYDALVFDEGHYFSGMKSQMHKAALAYIRKHNPEIILIPTATPYMSTPWNIYSLAAILGHHWSYMDFKHEFFDDRYLGSRTIPVVKDNIERQIAERVARIGSTVRLEDCADVPEQMFEKELFALTKAQIKAKENIKKEETNPVVKFLKSHQIDCGTLKGNEYVPDQFFEADKNARILDLCEEHLKIAIVCRYNLQIDLLAGELKKKGKNVFVIRGDVKDRDAVVTAVENSKEAIVLIQAACSEGYELPSVGVIAFASLSNSYKDYKQMQGRFLRINALKKNVFVHLITAGSVDEAVFASIMKKQDFSFAIYAGEQGEVVSSEDEQAGSELPD